MEKFKTMSDYLNVLEKAFLDENMLKVAEIEAAIIAFHRIAIQSAVNAERERLRERFKDRPYHPLTADDINQFATPSFKEDH